VGILLLFLLATGAVYAFFAETYLSTEAVAEPTQLEIVATTSPVAKVDSTPAATPSEAVPVESSAESPTKPKVGHFGVAVGQTLSGLSKAALEAELDDLVSVGVGWVRVDIDWSEIQPIDGEHFNWSNIDRIVAATTARDMKVVATLGYTPRWARLEGCYSSKCAPGDFTDFARFVEAAVKRYSEKGIGYWEIWNEPNIVKFWQPRPDIADYVHLLEVSYEVIKRIDPDAVVISGGLAPSATSNGNIAPLEFIAAVYAKGGGAYFDALGFHPYTFPAPPSYTRVWNAWSQMSSTNPSLRSIMVKYGDADKKIWLTEFGAPTGGPGNRATTENYSSVQHPSYVSEQFQASQLKEAFTLAEEYTWAGPLFWYSYKDLGTSEETIENFFGLLRFDGSKKPSYIALQELFNAEAE